MDKCPVPKEQRPINEYMELVQSNFFNWPFLSESLYTKKLLNTFFLCFLLGLPILAFFFNINQSFVKLFLMTTFLGSSVLFTILVRLLLVWNYIKGRLENSTVFYEESGWYDGRLWVKSKNILIQEKLIHKYQIIPAIRKLQDTLLRIFCLMLSLLFLIQFY